MPGQNTGTVQVTVGDQSVFFQDNLKNPEFALPVRVSPIVVNTIGFNFQGGTAIPLANTNTAWSKPALPIQAPEWIRNPGQADQKVNGNPAAFVRNNPINMQVYLSGPKNAQFKVKALVDSDLTISGGQQTAMLGTNYVDVTLDANGDNFSLPISMAQPLDDWVGIHFLRLKWLYSVDGGKTDLVLWYSFHLVYATEQKPLATSDGFNYVVAVNFGCNHGAGKTTWTSSAGILHDDVFSAIWSAMQAGTIFIGGGPGYKYWGPLCWPPYPKGFIGTSW